jgi:hypothetical protein
MIALLAQPTPEATRRAAPSSVKESCATRDAAPARCHVRPYTPGSPVAASVS